MKNSKKKKSILSYFKPLKDCISKDNDQSSIPVKPEITREIYIETLKSIYQKLDKLTKK